MKDRIANWIVDSGLSYDTIAIIATLVMMFLVYLDREKIKNWDCISGIDKFEVIATLFGFLVMFIGCVYFIFFFE